MLCNEFILVIEFNISAPTSRVQGVRLLGKNPSSARFEWDAMECSLRHGLPFGYNYEALCSEYGHSFSANTTKTSVRVSGLIPFAHYTFRVRFMNQAGYGYYSEPLQFETLQSSKLKLYNFEQIDINRMPEVGVKI